MKVFFVSSGNSDKGISPIINAQGESLIKTGIKVDYYAIKGQGILGYIRNVKPLREKIKQNRYDICHSHYSLCGFVTTLALLGKKKQVKHISSLMGSDVNSSKFWMSITRNFANCFWNVTIVKSEDMRDKLGIQSAKIIPNGVDIDLFRPIDKDEARRRLGLGLDKDIILFAADPNREVKNFPLAKKAYNLLNNKNTELVTLGNILHHDIPFYINSADVLLLTSKWEGSPNIIKEGMACNCPIVSTDVGDVRWLLGEKEGHYVSNNTPSDIAEKLKEAILFNRKTQGRCRLKELELDSVSVAKKLINVYNI